MEQEKDRYAFDAPSEVVDLAELHNAPCDDDWFEKRESGGLSSSLTETPHRETPLASVADAPPSNIVTSWGSSKPSTSLQPQRVSKRKMEESGPPEKKQRKNPEAQPLRRSARRSPQGPALRRSARRSPQGPERKPTTVPKSLRATKSTSCLPSTSTSTELSSEEMEVQRMKQLQREVALHRKKNEASYKAALAGNPPPVKLAIAPTIPREFNFKTDARIKSVPNNSTTRDETFIQQLRKPYSPVKASKGATVPKPFNLSLSRSRKESAPYVPMAQQIQEFQKRTPERYHQPSRQATQRGPSPVKATHRPTVKEPTVPEGFQLQIEKRLQERQAKKPPPEEEEEEPPHLFKSQPVSKKMLEGVVGVPEKKLPSLTVPESPAFALKKRIRLEPPQVQQVKPPSPIRGPPVPHFGLPFQPKLPEQHQVELCPFSFDRREQERRALKEKRLQQLRNQEVPKFKAQPLPDFSEVVLPEKKKPEVTKPEPFNLIIDTRGAEKTSRFENKVQEEQKQREEATQFKARPNVVTHKEPFKPKERGDTSCVVAPGFQLLTERRALERQDFERRVNEKEALRALMEEQQRREEEEREREEITRLRQEQVHKAQPVKHYRCVKLKKSETPLTLPQSPNFSDRFRM